MSALLRKQFTNINAKEYSEEAAVTALYENTDKALILQNWQMDDDPNFDNYDHIQIIVNGVVHDFILGGPQTAGINKFIEQICDENLYAYPGEPVKEPDFSVSAITERIDNYMNRLIGEIMTAKNINSGDVHPLTERYLSMLEEQMAETVLQIVNANDVSTEEDESEEIRHG